MMMVVVAAAVVVEHWNEIYFYFKKKKNTTHWNAICFSFISLFLLQTKSNCRTLFPWDIIS